MTWPTERRRALSGPLTLLVATAGLAGCSELRSHLDGPGNKIASAGPDLADPYLASRQPVEAAEKAVASRAGEAKPDVTLSPPVALAESGSSPKPPVDDAANNLAEVRAIVTRARSRLASMASYQVRLTRQERIGETLQEAEDVLLSVRERPKAVRIEWPTGPHRGREAIYSATETGGMLQVNMADSAIPMPRMSLPPDSPLVLRNSRHPITEAGLDKVVDDLDRHIRGKGDGSLVRYEGRETPVDVGRPCEKLVSRAPSGENWIFYFDAENDLPAIVLGKAPNGDLLERYVFRDVQADAPSLAAADAFDPARRWGPPQGLFGRLARGNNRGSKADDKEGLR